MLGEPIRQSPLEEEERHKLMCASKDASMALLTKKIESKKCKKLKVAGKNDVKQEDKCALVALAHQATHLGGDQSCAYEGR